MQHPVTPLDGRAQETADGLLSVLVELSFARNLEQLTEVSRKAARRLTAADGVTFVLRHNDCCHYVDEEAIAPLWKGRRFPLDECVSGWVMTHGEVAVIPDIYSDARVKAEYYRPTFVKSLLMVPVRKEAPVAAIGVYWSKLHAATTEERELVQAVANGAGLAMANVQLVRDLEEAAERERKARQVAERANQLTDQFLATVSHELRTPLNVINGWLWQLRQPGMPEALTRHALDVLERNATLQSRLVEELLDASRAMSGGLRLDCAEVEVNRLCAEVADGERATARAKGVRLQFETAPEPLAVRGDAERLRQVLRHLIDNSIKFTPAGGRIVVRASRLDDNRVRFSVADTGIGIRRDAVRRVFDRFFQVDGSATRKAGGLGLGLTLVREFVRLHGGAVCVESPGQNRGTTITVSLPCSGADEASSQAEHGGINQAPGITEDGWLEAR